MTACTTTEITPSEKNSSKNRRKNKTKYSGTGHEKVKTPLNFEPPSVADEDCIVKHRRKDPCKCTILSIHFNTFYSLVFISF